MMRGIKFDDRVVIIGPLRNPDGSPVVRKYTPKGPNDPWLLNDLAILGLKGGSNNEHNKRTD